MSRLIPTSKAVAKSLEAILAMPEFNFPSLKFVVHIDNEPITELSVE